MSVHVCVSNLTLETTPTIFTYIPIHRAKLDVIVSINLHQHSIPYVTMQPSDGKVWIILYSLDGNWVLHNGIHRHT